MNNRTFQKYYTKYFIEDRIIQRLARKLAKSDTTLYDELVQVGLIALWKLDPKKALHNEDAWIRQALKNRMIDFIRKELPKKPLIESLDGRLESGDQLEKNPDTGDFFIITNKSRVEYYPEAESDEGHE